METALLKNRSQNLQKYAFARVLTALYKIILSFDTFRQLIDLTF